MEIERKFKIEGFPDLPIMCKIDQWQGYLSVNEKTEIRIRHTINHTRQQENWVLCVKSINNLVRHEVEAPLTGAQFEELASLLDFPLIHKEQRVYTLPQGWLLECSRVDEGAFSYAEVEFPTQADCLNWQPPEYLGRELTWEKGFKMREYWSDRSLARNI